MLSIQPRPQGAQRNLLSAFNESSSDEGSSVGIFADEFSGDLEAFGPAFAATPFTVQNASNTLFQFLNTLDPEVVDIRGYRYFIRTLRDYISYFKGKDVSFLSHCFAVDTTFIARLEGFAQFFNEDHERSRTELQPHWHRPRGITELASEYASVLALDYGHFANCPQIRALVERYCPQLREVAEEVDTDFNQEGKNPLSDSDDDSMDVSFDEQMGSAHSSPEKPVTRADAAGLREQGMSPFHPEALKVFHSCDRRQELQYVPEGALKV